MGYKGEVKVIILIALNVTGKSQRIILAVTNQKQKHQLSKKGELRILA